ncbi:MAG TPA: ABC transporter ATP-binding protein [Candidatus Nitrosotalea sp.]|nr:ABC transporter ATP-binding protein [Candidatus Nitrosotalea sp.]
MNSKRGMILKNMTSELVEEKNDQNKIVDNNSYALRVENLSKIYDSSAGRVVALDNVSFAIKKGEFVSVVGPSGSGKSTVLNLVGALDRPTSGKIYIDGIDIFSLNDSQIATMRNSRIGFIFQSFNLINRTTVQKNVKLPGIIAGMSNDEVHSRSIKILEALGIADKKNQKPVNLSGGQQQRVAIARSLINNPTIILADEPTGNLDTKTGDDVFDMLKMLSHKFKRTIIMVTHNPELAESTDRSILLRDGRIEKDVIN